jgi:transmembrane sensor
VSRHFSNVTEAIQSEAGEWVLRLDEAPLDATTRRHLLAWLKTSPGHIDEFLLASAVWHELDGIDAGKRIDVAELLTEAGHNVVALSGDGISTQPVAPSPATSRRRWLLGIAASLTAAVGLSLFFTLHDPVQRYETSLGQQTLFTLDDGSVVHLNTQSVLTVRMSGSSRELELTRGEAMFEVAKDPDRPFRVTSGGVLVEAIGTRFNVYRRDDGVQVSVVEGEVKVESRQTGTASTTLSNAMPAGVHLTAGQEARSTATGEVALIETPDLEKRTAWREQRLVFREDSLQTVAAEFNRYNSTRIVIDAPAEATRRITGTFDAHDPASFAAFLERDRNLTLTHERGTIRVSAATR